ncbi:hypothetical protein [Ruegeria arenilitoris]|uniref:hypothetical protein n=1 Tax=Ruegeria arenilitoris TaxID=1173585 RepID=UPI00147C548B|nr:hypothetical protein [Ruegeria arenilitoris]
MAGTDHIAAITLNKRQRELCGQLARQILTSVCRAMNAPWQGDIQFDPQKQESAERGAYFSHQHMSAFEKADDTLVKLGVFQNNKVERILTASADEVAAILAQNSDLTLLHLAEALSGFFELPAQMLKISVSKKLVEALYDCGFVDTASSDAKLTKQIQIMSWVYGPQYDGPANAFQKLSDLVDTSEH